VKGRLYIYHTTKTAKTKTEGDITLQQIAIVSMWCSVISSSFFFLQF